MAELTVRTAGRAKLEKISTARVAVRINLSNPSAGVGVFKLGTLTLRPKWDGYSGYAFEDEATVTKLLGRDGGLESGNEVVQTSALGSRSCSIECYADTIAERDALVSTLWTRTTHDEGTGDPVHQIIVVAAKARIFQFAANPHWIVAMKFRERTT